MQDYNYWSYGCYEITIELTCCKYPPASDLKQIWLDNKKSLVEYLKLANTGIKGIVTYANGQPAVNLTVKIDSREPYFKTNKYGEFYRILNPGVYKLAVMLDCDTTVYETSFKIESNNASLVLNITLDNSLTASSISKYALTRKPVFCSKTALKCSTYDGIVTGNINSSNGAFKSAVWGFKSYLMIIFCSLIFCKIF
jgi:hypothetical protein